MRHDGGAGGPGGGGTEASAAASCASKPACLERLGAGDASSKTSIWSPSSMSTSSGVWSPRRRSPSRRKRRSRPGYFAVAYASKTLWSFVVVLTLRNVVALRHFVEAYIQGLVLDEVAPFQHLVAAEDGALLSTRTREVGPGRGRGVDVAARPSLHRLDQEARRDGARQTRRGGARGRRSGGLLLLLCTQTHHYGQRLQSSL